MKIRLLAALLCAAAFAVNSSVATAAYITTNASFYAIDPGITTNPGGNPPVTGITRIGYDSGQLWTNQITGAPFQAGGIVRTVGAAGVANLIPGVSPTATPDGSPYHMVFAAEGVIQAPGTAAFSSGAVYFIASETGNSAVTFDALDPSTWNFDNAFAKFDLAAPGAVLDGNQFGVVGEPTNLFSAASANRSTIDAFGETGEGFFIFQEDTSFAPGPTFVNPGLGTRVGDEWMYDVEGGMGRDGLSFVSQQSTSDSPNTPNAVNLAILNAIAMDALGAPFAGVGFEFNPVAKNEAPGVQTGDFSASLTLTANVVTVVPEPSSLAVFALLGGGVAVRFTKRRLKKAQSA